MNIGNQVYHLKFGVRYYIERILVSKGIRKGFSNKAILDKQRYYEKLDISQYQNELQETYRISQGGVCNFANPQTFTEKIQWLKLYDCTEEKVRLADKYLVREWIQQEIGDQYLIPLLGAWDSFDEINFESLPNAFVLKCNHGAKMNLVVQDKEKLDKAKAKKIIDGWLKQDFGLCEGTFQLQYSFIPRKIIAEKYMKETGFNDLRDYKFFCFNGRPTYCQVISDRSESETVDFFDMEWNHLNFTGLACFRNSSSEIQAPKSLKNMVLLSQKLSRNFSFVRVDFYEIDGKPYFGEMTFTPASGLGHFEPDEMNSVLGKLIQLPEKKAIPKIKK